MTKKLASELEKTTRKRRVDGERNRERLLLTAAEIFRAEGSAASLEAVARAANVGIGTLYRHFPTREALFEAVYRREVEQLAQLAEELSALEDPVGALRRWLQASVRMIATKKGMLAALALAIESSSELYAYSAQRLTGAVSTLLEAAVSSGRIRRDISSEDLLHSVIGICATRSQPGWELAAARLVDVLVDGLGVQPRT